MKMLGKQDVGLRCGREGGWESMMYTRRQEGNDVRTGEDRLVHEDSVRKRA